MRVGDETLPWLAASAWLGALLGSWVGFGAVPAGPVVLVVLLLAGGALIVVRHPSGRSTVALALLVGIVAGGGANLRAGAAVGGPVATAVARAEGVEGLSLLAELELTGDPRSSPHGGWWCLARLVAVEVPGEGAVATGERVVLRGSDDPPAMGARVAVEGLASAVEGDAAAWFARQGAVVQVRAVRTTVRRQPPGWLAATTWLRDRVAMVARARLPVEEASLLSGLVTGDVREQPPVVGDQMTEAGLSHLVAVSGSNVALVVAAVMGLALVGGAGRRAAMAAAFVAIWWFVLLVRAEPSVVRAALMASLVLAAAWVGRRRATLSLLSGAVVVALLVDPLLAGRVGFVLSVAATVGVVVLTPVLVPRLSGPRWFRTGLATTIGAQVAVAPVLLVTGGRIGLSAVLANVVAIPAAAASSMAGAVAAAVAVVAPGPAGLLCGLARPSLAMILWAARTFAGPAGQRVDRVGWVALLVGGVVVVVRRVAGSRRGVATRPGGTGLLRRAVVVVPALLPVVAALLAGAPASPAPGVAQLVALDIGQGDALLVGDPVAGWMLVDGGPDPVELRRGLRRHGVEALAAVVLSHPHADHADGLAGLMGHLPVGAVVVGPLSEDSPLVAEARSAGVEVTVATTGVSWVFGSTTVAVLSPPPGGIAADPNESSLVLRVEVDGGASALLAGDAELIAQTRLLGDPAVVDVDVLKVPHHGGDTNADGFLVATTPEIAVISAGEGNPFGHPHPDVLADLAGVDVRRTDHDGDIVLPLK